MTERDILILNQMDTIGDIVIVIAIAFICYELINITKTYHDEEQD